MVKEISFTPPSSVSLTLLISVFHRRASAYMEYMRYREWANRAASSPPTPARISMMTFFPSLGSLGKKQDLQLLLQPLQVGLGLVELLLGQLLHLRVGQEGLGLLLLLLGPQVLPVGLYHRGELVLLLVQLGHLAGSS